jgi:hypothetical protein
MNRFTALQWLHVLIVNILTLFPADMRSISFLFVPFCMLPISYENIAYGLVKHNPDLPGRDGGSRFGGREHEAGCLYFRLKTASAYSIVGYGISGQGFVSGFFCCIGGDDRNETYYHDLRARGDHGDRRFELFEGGRRNNG